MIKHLMSMIATLDMHKIDRLFKNNWHVVIGNIAYSVGTHISEKEGDVMILSKYNQVDHLNICYQACANTVKIN